MTETIGPKNRNTRIFHMGHRTRGFVPDDTGRVQNRTGQNSNKSFDQNIQ